MDDIDEFIKSRGTFLKYIDVENTVSIAPDEKILKRWIGHHCSVAGLVMGPFVYSEQPYVCVCLFFENKISSKEMKKVRAEVKGAKYGSVALLDSKLNPADTNTRNWIFWKIKEKYREEWCVWVEGLTEDEKQMSVSMTTRLAAVADFKLESMKLPMLDENKYHTWANKLKTEGREKK